MKQRFIVSRDLASEEGWYVYDRLGYEDKPVLCKTRKLARDLARSKNYNDDHTTTVYYGDSNE